MSDPSSTGAMSGTSARARCRNDPLTARPRACWASRIEPARSCIRGTIWTADRTTNAIRWLAPRATSASSRSSASVVNRNATEREEGDHEPSGRDEPEGQPLTGDRERPDVDEDVRRAREEQRVDDEDRDEQDGRDPQRPEHRPGGARRTTRRRRASRARTGRTTAAAGTPPAGPARPPAASSADCADAASSIPGDGSSRWPSTSLPSVSSPTRSVGDVVSPRLNIVRTVIGSAPRMRKTTV